MEQSFSVPFAQNRSLSRRDALKCGLAGLTAASMSAGRLHAEDAARLHDLPVTAAVLAGDFLRARPGSRAMAIGALLVAAKADLFLHAAGGFHQIESHVAANVGPFDDAPSTSASPAAKDVAKHVAERRKNVLNV